MKDIEVRVFSGLYIVRVSFQLLLAVCSYLPALLLTDLTHSALYLIAGGVGGNGSVA